MNQITDIKRAGREKFNVFVDGSFFCTLAAETILKSGIKTGDEINKDEIEKIQEENEKTVALDRSLKYLANMKTEKQVRDYLYSKGYTSKTVNYCMSKLNDYKYLNDEEFAKMYVKSYCYKKGKRLLAFELKSKGVSEEIIKNTLDNLEENEEVLINLAEKFLKNKPRDRKTAQKLFAHLSSKGFNFEEISKVVKKRVYDFEASEE